MRACEGVKSALHNRSRVVTPLRLQVGYSKDPKGIPEEYARDWMTETIDRNHPQTVRLTVEEKDHEEDNENSF
jgi:hypothetical protein